MYYSYHLNFLSRSPNDRAERHRLSPSLFSLVAKEAAKPKSVISIVKSIIAHYDFVLWSRMQGKDSVALSKRIDILFVNNF